MIRLTKVGTVGYRVVSYDNKIHTLGLQEDAFEALIHLCGIPKEEVRAAFDDMEQKDHDQAVFGVFNTFIYSDNIKDSACKI